MRRSRNSRPLRLGMSGSGSCACAQNFGQTAALAAGLDLAGEVVIFMDGDLQNDPAEIPRLLQTMDEGVRRRQRLAENRKDG